MKWLFCGMIVLSVIFGCLNGRMEQVSNAAIQECTGAVELTLALLGGMCLWSGIMNVADKAGITKKLSRLFSPITRLLFKGLPKDSPALKAITMNITANLLGLGNAATPLGLTAMKHLDEQSPKDGVATNHMITFVVLNTASIQLIPTTIATLRLKHGAASPMDVMPAILLASFISLVFGLVCVQIFNHFGESKQLSKDISPSKRKQAKSTHLAA